MPGGWEPVLGHLFSQKHINTHIHKHARAHTNTHLDDLCEVFAVDVVVCLQKYLSKATLAHRIVLSVELVKPVKSISILSEK